LTGEPNSGKIGVPANNPTERRPKMTQAVPPVAILVAHRVADYDAWKKEFDDHLPARKEAGCLGHYVHRDADDPNMIYVYCPAMDPDKIRTFVDAQDTRDVMKKAGVEGTPTITVMKPTVGDVVLDEKLPAMIVTHDVEDYDRWLGVYKEFDADRKERGVAGHAVNQELGNPNRVIVYHEARDMEILRTLMGSDELKDAMQRAGVASAPDVRFVETLDIAEY
jgi:quinol monooxygenase YgiN